MTSLVFWTVRTAYPRILSMAIIGVAGCLGRIFVRLILFDRPIFSWLIFLPACLFATGWRLTLLRVIVPRSTPPSRSLAEVSGMRRIIRIYCVILSAVLVSVMLVGLVEHHLGILSWF